jgi:hypothetical protein
MENFENFLAFVYVSGSLKFRNNCGVQHKKVVEKGNGDIVYYGGK